MINQALRTKVQELLGRPIKNIRSVSGGSINQAARVTTNYGATYFLKWNNSAADDMFHKEQKGLELLQSAESGLRIPEVMGIGSTEQETDFILMSYIPEGSSNAQSHQLLGKGLAALHKNTAAQYGLSNNNYIGRLPQSNKPHDNWIDFFIEERLEPQLNRALDAGTFSSEITSHFRRLYKQLPDLLVEEPASLIHGDLWSGNYFFDDQGRPAIYDPAAYYGNREIEIAMTHLFGGFSRTFYDAYSQAFPLQSGFEQRKDIYNLYPLLVHANLFGTSYARRVEGIVKRF